jgi:hypothetical protein
MTPLSLQELFSVSEILSLIVRLRGLFIGFRRVLETLVNLGNSEFHLLDKLGDNPITNRSRIRPELSSYLAGRFWNFGARNLENVISQ